MDARGRFDPELAVGKLRKYTRVCLTSATAFAVAITDPYVLNKLRTCVTDSAFWVLDCFV